MAQLLTVKGLQEVKALFARVGDEAGKQPLRRGVSAGAKVVKAAVIAAAPVRKGIIGKRGSKRRPPGTLKAAVIMKFVREQSLQGQALTIVTVRQGRAGAKKKLASSKDAFYAKYVERGHRIVSRGHKIGTYRGRSLYSKSIKARRASTSGTVPANPFMARAFAASKDRAVVAMVSTMNAELQKIVQK